MNKVVFLIGVLISICVLACNPDSNSVSRNGNLIEYTGRVDFRNIDSPEFSYSGVSIRTAFEGASVSVRLYDEQGENEFYAILDGNVVKRFRLKKGSNEYNIASNLKDTIHEIELVRLTECLFGITKFEGFILDKNNSLIPLTKNRELLFEFIGNSITCGYGNEGTLDDSFSSTTENHYNTYAAITSRAFNARHMVVSRSGIGIYRNYDGPKEGNKDCMPNIYHQIHYDDTTLTYGFEENPDLIFINLGTNDFSTAGCDSGLFVQGYLEFIDDIQQKNEGVGIVCLLGSMLGGESLIKARNYIKTIVELASAKEKGNVYFFEMSEQQTPYGIDYHPTTQQHLINAKELINFVHKIKGWEINTNQIKLASTGIN